MSNLLFLLLVLAIVFSTSEAISCYNHYAKCSPTLFCLNDANRKNCSSSREEYCFKDTYIFSLAIRGCAESGYCNETAFLGTRHCCNTDYCNHAGREISIIELMPAGKQSPVAAAAAAKALKDNRANQCNPNHAEYRGHQPGYEGKGNKTDLDNHARQLDPKNPHYKPKQ